MKTPLHDRDAVIAANPLVTVCQDKYGMRFTRIGQDLVAACPFHADGKRPNFRVQPEKNLWFCDVCGFGGSVVDLVMRKENVDTGKAFEILGGNNGGGQNEMVEVAVYSYTDENGAELYQVVRYSPKTFRQRHKVEGKWVWNMEGVRRILYQLPRIKDEETVFVVEGEKDVENLWKLKLPATCNVGGAKKWMDSYSDTLKGKRVIVWPDNDEPGKAHAEMVIKSIAGKAKEIYRFTVDDKDASDFIARVGLDKAVDEIERIINASKPVDVGLCIPTKSMADLEEEYRTFIHQSKQQLVNLGAWLPSLGRAVRTMVPGEVVVFLADTGVGKSACLQNLAMAIHPTPTLFFEMELPGSLMFERWIQMHEKLRSEDVWEAYRDGAPISWKPGNRLSHIHTCTMSRMNLVEMERIINVSELKIGSRPVVVMIDYVGLIAQPGSSRYERMSAVAEGLKIMAKETNTVIIMASQVGRDAATREAKTMTIHDAKDSGSIENSAGLVIGVWREGDGSEINLKILKNTKGKSGQIIKCRFDVENMRIGELSKINESDLPEYDVD